MEAYLDAVDTSDSSSEASVDDSEEESGQLPGGDSEDEDSRRHEPPSRKPVKKTRGRASVPSWDEIMFGGSNQD